MVLKRSGMVGMTDYTGASFEDIMAHLQDWRRGTDEDIQKLRDLRLQVEENRAHLDAPQLILLYIDHFLSLFTRYRGDFERLLEELPHGVAERHVEIVRQLFKSSDFETHATMRFSEQHIHRDLKDESLRHLVDEIYRVTRGRLDDNQDLSNLRSRLATYIGKGSGMHDVIIKVTHSTVGILNLGTLIGDIQNNLTILQTNGHPELADALQRLTETIANADSLGDDRKEALEQLAPNGRSGK